MARRSVFTPAVVLAAMVAACAAALFTAVGSAEAAFPGKNGKIAFSSNATTGEGVDNPEGDYEIFTIAPGGTNLTQLTRNATDDSSPEWSADGGRIAYSGHDGNDREIYTVPSSGGAPTQVTDNAEDDASPTFSPDGAKIAYEGVAPINEEIPDWKVRRIYTILSSGGTPTVVVDSTADSPHYGPHSPEWSPDGSKIAYHWNTEGGEGYSRLRVVKLADGESYTVTKNSPVFSEWAPDWAPDGSRIVFEGYHRDDPEFKEVYKVAAGGGTPVKLTDTPKRWEDSPVWSPDGSRIAFSAPGSPAPSIYKMPAGGGTPTNITSGLGLGSVESLDWGPQPPSPDATDPTITRPRPAPGSDTRDRTPTVSATVRDAEGELTASYIRLFIDGAPKTFSYDPATDRLSRTTGRLSYGWHRARVVAEDSAGNDATRAWSFRVVRRR